MPFARTRCRRAPAMALAVMIGALAAAPAAVAGAPSVAGTVTGNLPQASRAATRIRALELGSTRQAAATTVSPTGAFRLALPPGAYVLDMSITPRHGRAGAAVSVAIPVSIAPGQRRPKLRISKAAAQSSAAGAPFAQAAYTKESGQIAPGRVAFSIENFAGATGDMGVLNAGLASMLKSDVSPGCRSTQVAGSADRAIVEQELQLQKSRYFDPATRVKRNFITPDIVVRGLLQSHGGTVGYAITLTDSRTGKVLETVSGTLPSDATLFAAERGLASRLAKRICAYGEVFEVTLTGTGTGTFAPHSATGTLSAGAITAKPSAQDSGGATKWTGSAPAGWTGVSATSNLDCSFGDYRSSGGTWTAKLERAGDALRVQWLADAATGGTATTSCPNGEGAPSVIPGLPTTALVGSTPSTFILPADARQAITGGEQTPGAIWDNTLELKVRTIRMQAL